MHTAWIRITSAKQWNALSNNNETTGQSFYLWWYWTSRIKAAAELLCAQNFSMQNWLKHHANCMLTSGGQSTLLSKSNNRWARLRKWNFKKVSCVFPSFLIFLISKLELHKSGWSDGQVVSETETASVHVFFIMFISALPIISVKEEDGAFNQGRIPNNAKRLQWRHYFCYCKQSLICLDNLYWCLKSILRLVLSYALNDQRSLLLLNNDKWSLHVLWFMPVKKLWVAKSV